MPALLHVETHWSASKAVGLNSLGSSLPSPQSRSVNVFTPKWAKQVNSISCQASCCLVGVTWAALRKASRGTSADAVAESTAQVKQIQTIASCFAMTMLLGGTLRQNFDISTIWPSLSVRYSP